MRVDLVCGPLLTLVLYNPAKPKRELVMDLSLVVVLQGLTDLKQVRSVCIK